MKGSYEKRWTVEALLRRLGAEGPCLSWVKTLR